MLGGRFIIGITSNAHQLSSSVVYNENFLAVGFQHESRLFMVDGNMETENFRFSGQFRVTMLRGT